MTLPTTWQINDNINSHFLFFSNFIVIYIRQQRKSNGHSDELLKKLKAIIRVTKAELTKTNKFINSCLQNNYSKRLLRQRNHLFLMKLMQANQLTKLNFGVERLRFSCISHLRNNEIKDRVSSFCSRKAGLQLTRTRELSSQVWNNSDIGQLPLQL